MGSWIGLYTMLQRKYSLATFLELAVRTRSNALRILPTIAVEMSKQQSFDLSRLSHVKYIMCAGGKIYISHHVGSI